MFGNKEKANYDRPTTVIGKETAIESGTIESKASIQVNGRVQSDVVVESSVVVGQSGLIEGDITAGFVLVAGKIVGNIEVLNQIHLTKTAIVIGDIVCQSIVIDDGAKIEGQFSMREPVTSEEKED